MHLLKSGAHRPLSRTNWADTFPSPNKCADWVPIGWWSGTQQQPPDNGTNPNIRSGAQCREKRVIWAGRARAQQSQHWVRKVICQAVRAKFEILLCLPERISRRVSNRSTGRPWAVSYVSQRSHVISLGFLETWGENSTWSSRKTLFATPKCCNSMQFLSWPAWPHVY